MSTQWQATIGHPGPGPEARKTPSGGPTIGASCVANISQRERRKRLAGGAILFFVSLAVLAALLSAGAGREWRLALLPLFWGAAVGVFQWRDRT